MEKRIMTKAEWSKKQNIKKCISVIIALIGIIGFIASFQMEGPTADYNGPVFLFSLITSVLGILSFVVLTDQTYKEYRKDALQWRAFFYYNKNIKNE